MIHQSVKMLKLLLVLCLLAFIDDSFCRRLYKHNDAKHDDSKHYGPKHSGPRHAPVKHQKHSKHGSKIVGGTETDITSYPYQVALFPKDANDTFLCGGSILSPKWILTAAHCLHDNIISVDVRSGSKYYDKGGTVFTTTKFKIHPKYNPQSKDYDIAVVNLDQNSIQINDKTTALTKLPPATSNIKDGAKVTVTGWGATKENGSVSEPLLTVDLNVVSRTQCKLSYRTVSDRMMCAGVPQGGKDTCQGDSGGPLIEKSTRIQYGIVSFGYGCARPGVPGVYSYVPQLRQWIKQETGV